MLLSVVIKNFWCRYALPLRSRACRSPRSSVPSPSAATPKPASTAASAPRPARRHPGRPPHPGPLRRVHRLHGVRLQLRHPERPAIRLASEIAPQSAAQRWQGRTFSPWPPSSSSPLSFSAESPSPAPLTTGRPTSPTRSTASSSPTWIKTAIPASSRAHETGADFRGACSFLY